MRSLFILLIAFAAELAAQGLPGLWVMGSGYPIPVPIALAPGQLVTLIANVEGEFIPCSTSLESPFTQAGCTYRAPADADLPSSLAGISASVASTLPAPPVTAMAMPVLMVSYFYSTAIPVGYVAAQAAVTVQVPLEASGGVLNLESAGQASQIATYLYADRIHVLTNCDPITTTNPYPYYASPNNTGLPCPPFVTHADGSLVSASHPASAGEELVAYATGLGQTNPALTTGKLVTAPTPTATTFGMDFNFRPNSLATKPLPGAPAPVFAGATPGYVGLYQVNFIVPQVPTGTLPCYVPPANATPSGFPNVVVSNLTVSIGGVASFDGAGICVAAP